MTASIDTALRVHCQREDILTALQTAEAVVPSSSAKPILVNLQLIVQQDSLEIIATDLQVGLRAIVRRLEVDREGQVVVQAKQLVSILRESSSPTVLLDMQASEGGSQVLVELTDGSYRIPAVVGEAFPVVSAFPEQGERFEINGPSFESMIKKTAFAVDRERSSAVLSGLFLRVGDGECLLAATDGKVLAEAVVTDEAYQGAEHTAILPASTVTHLSRILSASHPPQVELSLKDNLIFARVIGGSSDDGSVGPIQIELSSRLVEGSFPSYRNALPTDPQSKVEFKTSGLASAVRRTALMTSNQNPAIVLELKDGKAMFSNLNSTSGTARIPLDCTYDGGEERFGINAKYMGEVLRAFDGSDVVLELNGPGRGMIIRESGVTFLIMPISLPN